MWKSIKIKINTSVINFKSITEQHSCHTKEQSFTWLHVPSVVRRKCSGEAHEKQSRIIFWLQELLGFHPGHNFEQKLMALSSAKLPHQLLNPFVILVSIISRGHDLHKFTTCWVVKCSLFKISADFISPYSYIVRNDN